MRKLTVFFCAALSFLPALLLPASAQAQPYGRAELDALLAPVALYPDDVLRTVLDAATAPSEVAEAAQWSRNNRGMTGEDSVRAVQGYGWRPSVQALVAYPELLERMAESPRWTYDLGNAWLAQQAEVMSTVQELRQRAYASGNLRSDTYQTVQTGAEGIAVVPAQPYIYYVPYYDPFVVYGGWWWASYRPVYWRPWRPHPVFVTNVVVAKGHHHGHPHRPQVALPPQHHHHRAHAPQHQHRAHAPQNQHRPNWHARENRGQVQPYHRVPESQRRPIVQSHVPPASISHHREPRHHQQPSRPAHGALAPQRSAPAAQHQGHGQRQHRGHGRS
jgi:hypothetical protein